MTREPDVRGARVAYASLTGTGRQRLGDMPATAEETATEVFTGPVWAEGDIALLSGLLPGSEAPGSRAVDAPARARIAASSRTTGPYQLPSPAVGLGHH